MKVTKTKDDRILINGFLVGHIERVNDKDFKGYAFFPTDGFYFTYDELEKIGIWLAKKNTK